MQKIRQLIISKKDYLLLILISLLAYWPISLNIFTLKNDALIYFLPYRYQVSESIQNGMFPWWNPYLYTGLPIHSDIQSGVWNPVVMLISLFTSYNMSVLQWEMIFYLSVGSIGVYKLIRELNLKPSTALVSAVAYLCCGFMTDSGAIIPWITSAAYLPFTFLYFLRLLNHPDFKTAIKLSIALSLLLTAGYPSFFIYSLYIILAGSIGWIIVNYKQIPKIKTVLTYAVVAVIAFLAICSPVLISWFDFLSYYDRGTGTNLNRALSNSFPPFSTISYLLPSAVSKSHEWLKTDLVARNASTGIFIIIFFVLSFFEKFTHARKFILAVIIFSFLFSLGSATPLREICYNYFPLMDSFRHPGSMRVFTTLGIILMAAPILNKILTDPAVDFKRLNFVSISLIIIMTGIILYYLPHINLFQIRSTGINKPLLDSLNFADMAVIQGVIQLLFLVIFLFLVTKKKIKLLVFLSIINSVIFCWMALPFTFISQVKTSTIDQSVKSIAHGFPLPDLNATIKSGSFSTSPAFDYRLLLAKTISIQDQVITPTINTSYLDFLNDTALRKTLSKYPPFHISDSSTISPIEILKFSNNSFTLKTSSQKNDMLDVFQQYHHGWTAKVDNKETPIFKSNKAFMRIALPPGTHHVVFDFQPGRLIKGSVYVSLFTLFLILVVFVVQSVKNNRYSI